jgi:rhodanese-related sulfurtransferase
LAQLARDRKIEDAGKPGLIFVELAPIGQESDLVVSTVPFIHPLAKTVSYADALKINSQGAIFVDVRTLKEFQKGSLRQAVSTPFTFARSLKNEDNDPLKVPPVILSPEIMALKGQVVFPHLLPKDKAHPLVVFSRNALDFDGYNAVTLLAASGYTSLSFLRGGWDEVRSIPSEWRTPPDLFPININNLVTQLKAKNSNLVLVDVRPKVPYAKATIRDAIHLPVGQALDEFGHPRFRPLTLTAKDLQGQNEFVDFSKVVPKGAKRQIVVFGRNANDWAVLKAAVAAKAQGYPVLIFTSGWAEWRYRHELFGEPYRIKRPEILKAKKEEKLSGVKPPSGRSPKRRPRPEMPPRPSAEERQKAALEKRQKKIQEYLMSNPGVTVPKQEPSKAN